mgnify:CR=1 FL=1
MNRAELINVIRGAEIYATENLKFSNPGLIGPVIGALITKALEFEMEASNLPALLIDEAGGSGTDRLAMMIRGAEAFATEGLNYTDVEVVSQVVSALTTKALEKETAHYVKIQLIAEAEIAEEKTA